MVLPHIWDLILTSLQNQFLSGGLVLMLTGAVLALCRRVPLRALEWGRRRFTITVDISNDDPLFAWLSLWLAHHPYSKRARSLTATSERDEYGRSAPQVIGAGEKEGLPQILLTPAPGNHLLLYKRRLIWLTRDRKEASPGSADSYASVWRREVITIRVIGRCQQAARTLLEDARTIAMSRRQKKTEIFIAGYDYWESVGERDPRPLGSVFLPSGVVERIVDDVESFMASQSWYISRGIPYRRGYLFHGVPGSGKTSLIIALAGYFRMNLYVLNVAGSRVSDETLTSLLARVPLRSMVLLEDIDSAFNIRKKSEDTPNKLTFSGLLNALDGAASKEGALVFMTTNHIDRLDDALIRPGRADLHVEFGPALPEQAEAIFAAFNPNATAEQTHRFIIDADGLTMAQIQQRLLNHRTAEYGKVDHA
jgi:chaperone BCS1